MNPAARGGLTLLICLLAVFPCGAALTVLGTLAAQTVRALAAHQNLAHDLKPLAIPAVWAGSGVMGFISLIYGVDKLMDFQRRLPWYALLWIVLGIGAAGFFSLTYPLHTRSALFLRAVCVAPVAIELLLLFFHFVRLLMPDPVAQAPLDRAIGAMSTTAGIPSRKN